MRAQVRRWLNALLSTFWLLPALLVAGGLLLGETLVRVERDGYVSPFLLDSWLYGGGESGARTLLGAVASSTIGVAGTVFSITIAALTLASSQMGPRLLENFTRDKGNQVTLGLFLGTFAYALMALRAVSGTGESVFVPHLAVTVAVVLALGCVGLLVYFVHHMAGRINVDTVIDLVHGDLRHAIERLTEPLEDETDAGPGPQEAAPGAWIAARAVDRRHGYLQQLDASAIAKWAQDQKVLLRLTVRPGDFIFPGASVLEASRPVEGLRAVLMANTVVGGKQVGTSDLEYSVRQLVDVAVRALSPGINDPQTAVAVVNRLGASLNAIACRRLSSGVLIREGFGLTHPVTTYAGLLDVMFHVIRQNARGSASVLIRMLEVFTAVAATERDPARRAELHRHAQLVMDAGRKGLAEDAAVAELSARHRRFLAAAADSGRRDRVT